MEIADIPPVVDSGGGMGHINRQEPPSQSNTPTLRAPFTGLNEKLVKVQRCPATVGPGCTRSRGESGLRLAGMFRPSRKGAGIAGTIAMRSAPWGQSIFVECARAHSERERVSIRFQSVPQGNAQCQTRTSRRYASNAANHPGSDPDARFAVERQEMTGIAHPSSSRAGCP